MSEPSQRKKILIISGFGLAFIGVIFTAIFVVFQIFRSSGAVGPSGYYEYYIPGEEQQLWDIYNDFGGIPNQQMHSVIGVSGSVDGTKLYYDHWEDGYDYVLGDPVTADEEYTINEGQVIEFESSDIPVNPRGTTVKYDGRDRIYAAGGPVTVTRSSWGESTGTVLALAWEIYPTKPFLTHYTIPVGQNFDAAPKNYGDFDRVYVIVQSTDDANSIQVDDPTTGGIDIDTTLNKGGITQLYDVNAGTTVTATKPVQVQIIVADHLASYEVRGFSAVPASLWDNEYYNPVGGSASGNTDLYMYNPTAASLTLSYEDTTGTGSCAIVAGDTLSYSDCAGRFVPSGSGVHLSAPENFWALGSVDAESSTYDWGYSLVPTNSLTTNYFLGWAPGTSEATPTSNGSPAFVTPTQDGTVVNVDYSPKDGLVDASYTLNRLQSQKIFDPDHENTGMHIMSSAPIAVAWGEDPSVAAPGNPYLDLGYTTLPLFENQGESVLLLDKTANPTTVPNQTGEQSVFTLTANTQAFAVDNVDIIDDLPSNWGYVPGSATITRSNGAVITGGAADPVVSSQTLTWDLNDDMAANTTLTVQFTAQTLSGVVSGTYEDTGKAIGYRSGGTEIFQPQDTATVDVVPAADLSLTKTVDNATPIIGSNVSFTITVQNDGPDAATNVNVKDILPSGLAYVSNTPSQGTYTSGTGIWNIGTLNFGASATLQIVAQTTSYGTKTNGAEVVASDLFDPDSTPNNNLISEDDQDEATVTPQEQIDLSLAKTVNNNTPNVGTNVTFTLTLNNAGPSTATGVVVNDLLPSGYTYVSNTPSQGTYTQGTGNWNVGSLNATASATLQIVATVNGAGDYKNIAQVSAADQQDIDSTPNNDDGDQSEDDEDAQLIIPTPIIDLSLAKTVNNNTPNVGTNVTFTLTLNNAGPSTATGVVVNDLLPSGYTYVSNTPSQGTYTQGTGNWNVGSLNATASATLQIVATVKSTGEYKNITQVTAANEQDIDSTPNNDNGDQSEDDESAQNVIPVPIIDLSVTKGVNNASPNVGENVTFTVEVVNGGPSNATGVGVTDLLPSGYTYVSNTRSTGTYSSSTGLWSIGNLNVGASATLTLTGTVNVSGDYKNIVQVTAADQQDIDSTPNNDDGDQSEDDEAAAPSVPLSTIDLSLAKTVNNNTPNVGTNVTFTLTLNNAGPAIATGVKVKDLLPSGFTYVSSTPSQGTYIDGTGVWTVGTVNASASATLQIVATVNGAGDYKNIAQVSAADQQDIDSTPNNDDGDQSEDDEDAQLIIPTPIIDLSLAKTVNNNTPNVGTNVTFTLTLNNAGPSTATGVVVNDLLPSGYTYVSNTPSQGTYTQGTGNWNVGSLNATASATLQIVATVKSTGEYRNITQVTAANEQDIDSTPNNDNGDQSEDDESAQLMAPVAIIDLSLAKQIVGDQVSTGQVATFRVIILNQGPSNATGVQVRDLLPSGYTYVSATPSQGTYTAPTGLWDIGNIAAGETKQLELSGTLQGTGEYKNVTQVIAANEQDIDSTPNNDDGDQSEDDEAFATNIPVLRDLKITKSSDPVSGTVVLPGDTITYTLSYVNDGTQTYSSAAISDEIQNALSYVPGSLKLNNTPLTDSADTDAGVISNSNTLATVTLGTIPPSSSGIVSYKATIRELEFSEQGATNVGTITTTEEGPKKTNIVNHPVDPITITKTSRDVNGGSLRPGDEIQWTVTIKNIGLTQTTNVIVTDTMPDEVTYIPGTISGRGADDSAAPELVWHVGVLEIDEEVVITFNTLVKTTVPNGTKILNQAVVDSDQSNPKESDNPTTPDIDDPTTVLAVTGADLRVWIGMILGLLIIGGACIAVAVHITNKPIKKRRQKRARRSRRRP